ncbi:MAG: PAS domain S-box protein [Thermoproteota archaeon]
MIGINVDFSRSELGEVDRVRVLHVDDAPGFLKAASKMLEAQGNFQVDTAQSVKEGLEKLKRESFDAVVADYQMPEQDGLEFLKQLRDQGDQIPFIMFTGKGREEVAMRALNLGADRYLNKHGEPEVVYGELAHSIRRSVERYRVRREMEAREERFRVFLEGFQGIAYQVRVEDTEGEMGNFELLQGKVEEIAGHPAEDFLRKEKTWYKVIHPDDLQFVLQKRQKLLSNPGHMADVEYRILHKNGDIKWVRDISQTSQAGNMLQGTIYDITERKRMEEELRRSKEKYRELINGMGDTAWVIDLEGNFVDVNDTAVEVLGYSREELLSMGPTDIDSSLDPEEIRELIKNMPADEIQVFETTHITKQGEEIPVEVKSSLLTYQGKLAILSIARDITQRKLVEKKLRESEKWYRAVFENTGTAMCIVEEDKTLARVNRRFEEISGYSREEVEGKKWMQFVTPEHLQRMEVYHRERRKKGGEAPKHYSADFVDKEGRIKHGLLTVDLIPGTKRSVVSILDITERKQAEERLLLLSQAVNASTDSIALSDMEGRIIDVNEATLEIYGTEDREDLVGKNVFQLIAPEHREKAVEAMEEALKKGYIEHQEVNIKTKDGGKLPVEMNVSLMKNKEGEPTGFVGISRDITERIQREQQLRGEREILEKVTQNVGAGLTIISKDYRVIWANQLLRQSSEQVIGEYCYQVYNQRDSVCPRCGVKEIFETGKDYVVHEQKVKGPDGHPMWVKITATPLRDKEGNITAALELSTFHTEQKRMEEELRRSKEKYRKQFEGSLDGIVLADAETGEIIDCNQAAAELVGREKEELMGKPQTILHPPQEVEGGFSKTFLQHLQKKEDEVLESQVITKTGEIKDVAIKATHFELEGRTILQGVFRDITEQKRKKKALERYRKVVERTEDLVAAVDADYKYILVNDAFLEYHQLKREQVVGKTVKEVLGEDLFQEVIKPRIDRCLAGETVEYEMKHIHPELGERYFEVNYYSLRNEYTADPVVVSNIRDITQRKQAEENLHG